MITIDTNKMMIEHYMEMLQVTPNQVALRMKQYDIHIIGEHLHIVALSKYEVLVEGKLTAVNFVYDET